MAGPPSSPQPAEERPSWRRRFGWLLAIWLASVAALAVVALGFRLVMGWVGLTT